MLRRPLYIGLLLLGIALSAEAQTPRPLTAAEAAAGTSTASRVISPKVLHDYVTSGAVSDVQVNGTSVLSGGIANIQDSDFLSAATIAKWDAILGI